MMWRSAGVALLVIAVAGCSQQPATGAAPPSTEFTMAGNVKWSRVPPANMTDRQKAEQQRGLKAVHAMARRLMGELEEALDTGDPAAAVEVCRRRAPKIAQAIAGEYGLKIGRTSYRLRNPANVPPEWARELVADRVAGPTWLAGPDGELAGLLPIRLKVECTMCHGPKEEIAPEILSVLAQRYPKDAATGFHPGDLRGWFWVETRP